MFMNYNAPIFMRLHSNKVELIVNVYTINSVEQFNDNLTRVYLNHCNDPLYVDETYDEIKHKLLIKSIIL